MNVIYQSSDWAVNKNSMVAQEEGCQESDRLGIRASEPVAAVGHPPAKDADGDGGQKRPYDGQGEIRYQSQRCEGNPENLTLHSLILARSAALWPLLAEQISRRTTWQMSAC
jgi:hypothetical protein